MFHSWYSFYSSNSWILALIWPVLSKYEVKRSINETDSCSHQEKALLIVPCKWQPYAEPCAKLLDGPTWPEPAVLALWSDLSVLVHQMFPLLSYKGCKNSEEHVDPDELCCVCLSLKLLREHSLLQLSP